MNVLQIPIMDEYWVPPEAANNRTTDYAVAQGYGHGFMKPAAMNEKQERIESPMPVVAM